jgi:hypothetical protein
VDRVLARSESKARAVIEILRAEQAELGPQLRTLVLCDFADAPGKLPEGEGLTGSAPARTMQRRVTGAPDVPSRHD